MGPFRVPSPRHAPAGRSDGAGLVTTSRMSALDDQLAGLSREKLEVLVRAAADGVTGEELLRLVQQQSGGLDQGAPLSVVVFGATGDLAKKKLFPALYQLVLLNHFPRSVNIVGYGRKMP